jgi:large subunit ribosomal protein L22
MEVRSIYKSARVSPKKARDVAREIQGLPVSDAIDALNFTPRKAAFLINKTLKSAVANAENNHELAADNLVVKEAHVTDGPTFKRFKPRARGSASAIRKRTSHISIVLTDDIPAEEPKRDRSKSAAKPSAAPKKTKAPAKQEPVAEEEAVKDEAPVVDDAPAEETATKEDSQNA